MRAGLDVNEEEFMEEEPRRYSPVKIGIALAICALFLPYWFEYRPNNLTVWAGGWMLQIFEFQSTPRIVFNFANFGPLLPILLFIGGPQLLFAYFMYRVYSGKTTIRKAFWVGFIGFIPILILDFPLLIYLLQYGELPAWPVYPTPLSLFIGYIIIKKFPPPQDVPDWLQ